MHTHLSSCVLALILLTAAVTDGEQATFSGQVTDPRGDSTAGNRLANPPDLTAAEIVVAGGTLTLTVTFAPGTLSSRTQLTVYFDTDEDGKTGVPVFYREREPIGADYVIRGLQPRDPSHAALTHDTSATQQTFLGIIDVTSPSPNERRYVIPLSRLGGDDGRLKFKMECDFAVAESQDGSSSAQTMLMGLDQMPDRDKRPGLVR
jgi:hypothetical protein